MPELQLGLGLPWASPQLRLPVRLVRRAEELGFASVWAAEAYGSDALTPLAYLAAHTHRIRLGTSIMQAAARPPTAAAMMLNTLDALSGGRVIAGVGLSGPQIVEGWYGQPWGRPYWRLYDYLQILRKVLARRSPVVHEGRELQLPYRGPGALGVGKPLKSILHTNPRLPIFLGTGSRAAVILTAREADGWLPFGFVPGSMEWYRPWLEEGRSKRDAALPELHIQAGAMVRLTRDVAAALGELREQTAFYVGGMGHKEYNFHKNMMIRRGFPEAAERVQELFLAGQRAAAAEAVPEEYVDAGALVGPPQRIRQRLEEWRSAGVQGLTLYGLEEDSLERIAALAQLRPATSRLHGKREHV